MEFEPLKYIPEPDHAQLLSAPTRWERITFFFKKLFERKEPKIDEPKEPQTPRESETPRRPRKWFLTAAVIVGLLVTFFVCFLLFLSAPKDFPESTVLAVERGETLSGVTKILKNENAIRSPFFFKVFFTIFGGTRGLVAGDYYFKESQNSITLARRLTSGKYDLENIRVTIPEGFSSKDISSVFVKTGLFVRFDPAQFQKLSAEHEGYLFPDTYFFLPSVTAEEVISAMTKNFEKRIEALKPQIDSFGRSVEDVIIMASIIEREARTEESRRTIAGILWKRLDIDMPLQVDAAFALVNGKTDSAKITLDDLKINSPYNTYVNKGLPPGPIANPGLDSILATITPIKTQYYFYLSDSNGNMHYGVTHDQHIANKDRYLR